MKQEENKAPYTEGHHSDNELPRRFLSGDELMQRLEPKIRAMFI